MATDEPQDSATVPSLRPSTMALVTTPFVFTQDKLFTTGDFVKEAKARGTALTLDDLQDLHERGLLLPMFRVADESIEALKVDVERPPGGNARVWTLAAAADGRLRDPAVEGYSSDSPYASPDGASPDAWWNGYIYSSWQLLHLRHVFDERGLIEAGWHTAADETHMNRLRTVAKALVVLSPRFLPGVIGQASIPPGTTYEQLRQYRAEANTADLLRVADADPADLRREAEWLLADAGHHDPLTDWLPLLRHASFRAWMKLKGDPLHYIWLRIAAEVLLRAHDDLARAGILEPLPSLEGLDWHMSLHDRLGPDADQADTLERALGTFGLSPHPRALILVEGETELNHIPRLLAEFGLSRPEQIRVQQCEGSKVNPQLLARYGITPRLGRIVHGTQLLDRTPTALLIAMDPEHQWETQQQRDQVRANLQNAIREEVEFQGGKIGQADLDYLVTIMVWGADKYELANFTDDELVAAITKIATERGRPNVAMPTWEADLRANLSTARAAHQDIKVALGPAGVANMKTALAEELWPVLRTKCEAELASGTIITPALAVALKAQELVAQLSSGGYALQKP